MTSSIEGGHAYEPQLQDRQVVSCCNRQPIFIALIILGVVGIGALGLGVAGFGASQSWWTISAPFSHMGQMNAIILMSAGGGAGFLFLTVGAVGSVRSYIKKKDREMRAQIERREEAIRNLGAQLREAQAQVRALPAEVRECGHEDTIKDLERQLREAQASVREENEETIRGLQEKLEEAKARVNELTLKAEGSNNRLVETKRDLEEQLLIAQNHLRKGREESEETIRGLQEKLEEANARVNDLTLGAEDSKERLAELRRNFEEQLNDAQVQLRKREEVNEETVRDLQEKLKEANARIEQVEAKGSEEKLVDLRRNLEEAVKGAEDLQRKLDERTEECGRLNDRLVRAETDLKEEGEKVRQLSEELEQKKEALLRVEKEKVELEGSTKELAQALQILVKLEKDMKEQDQTIQILGEENKASNENVLRMQGALSKAEKRIRSLEQDRNKLKLEVSRLEGALKQERKEFEDENCRLLEQVNKSKKVEASSVSGKDKSIVIEDEDWEVVGSSSSVVVEKRRSRIGQAWKTFDYDLIAEQKYQVVLDEYVRNLGGMVNLKQLRSEVDDALRKDGSSQMLIQLQKVLEYLTEPEAQKPRLSYQAMVKALRTAIISEEYRSLSEKKSGELSPQQHRFRGFVRELCLVRWKGTHLHNYLKDIVHLSIGKDELPPFDLETYPDLVLGVNREIKHSPLNKKSKMALEGQKLCGAIGLEDFCGTKNTPNVRNTQYFQNEKGEILPLTYVRHGTPTALGEDYYSVGIAARQIAGPFARMLGYEIESGEEVTVDYKEYLRAMEERGESELFCVYQRRTPDTIENESARVKKIEGLQTNHPNTFVLVQPVEGDLFEHKGAYSDMHSFADLKKALENEFFNLDPDSPTTRAALPLYLRSDPKRKEEYRFAFKQLLKDVQELFFPGEEDAVAASLSSSVTALDSQLEKEYAQQARAIKEQLLGSGIKDLERVETAALDDRALNKLLEDQEIIEAVTKQITDLDELEKWVAVDREKTVKAHLENPSILRAVIKHIAGSISEKMEKSDYTAELEQKKAQFLAKWQSYILLVYAFQKMDLKFRLNGVGGFKLSAYKTPCKDFLDRGGNQGFVEDRLMHYMLGIEADPERMEETLYNLLGPPILVKKKEAIERRIVPGMHVERLLAAMDPKGRERLSQYTFGKEGWKPVGVETPKMKGQSGMPSVPRQIKQAIARVLPSSYEEIEGNREKLTEEITEIFGKYSGAEFAQWEGFDLPDFEGTDRNEEGFDAAKIRNQVERDTKPQVGVRFDIVGKVKTFQFKDYDSLFEKLLSHPLVKGDEQKALKILASFHQGTGAAAITPITSALGLALGELVTVAQKVPAKEDGTVRHYELDLSKDDAISIRFTDTYHLKRSDRVELLAAMRASALIEYRASDTGEMESEGYVSWSVKG